MRTENRRGGTFRSIDGGPALGHPRHDEIAAVTVRSGQARNAIRRGGHRPCPGRSHPMAPKLTSRGVPSTDGRRDPQIDESIPPRDRTGSEAEQGVEVSVARAVVRPCQATMAVEASNVDRTEGVPTYAYEPAATSTAPRDPSDTIAADPSD